MKSTAYFLFLTFYFLFFLSCTPKNAGFLTLNNSGVETIRIKVNERVFKIAPANHITKEIVAGRHKITIDNGLPVAIDIKKDKTTVVDSSGLSCFVVADFTQALQGGNPQIVERFTHQQVFTTREKMISILGAPLPKRPAEGERTLRVHQVDCDIIEDDTAIATAISNVP